MEIAENAKRFAGIITRDYDVAPLLVPGYFELQESLANRIAAQFNKPTIVDIGLGTGITTRAILSQNPGCRVKSVDNEAGMIAQAKSNLQPEVASGQVELHEADALDYILTLPSSSVDVVASSYALHNCFRKYRAKLEAEIFRVLKPGGLFINNDKYAADDQAEYIRSLADQIIRYDLLSQMGREDLRKIWIAHELEDQLPDRILWTRESLNQLTDAGFEGVSLVERNEQYAIVTAHKR